MHNNYYVNMHNAKKNKNEHIFILYQIFKSFFLLLPPHFIYFDMKKIIFLIAFFLSVAIMAQDDNKSEFSINADFVSSYIWRGMYCAGTSIQPSMDFTSGGFSIGAWGSVGIRDYYKEVDLFASYSIGNFTAGVLNYWVVWEGDYNYFDFSEDTYHQLEINLLYSFDSFPLTFGWNTLIAGPDHYIVDTEKKRAFSTYIDANYAFNIKEVELELNLGVSPWKSNVFYTNDLQNGKYKEFAFVNIAFTASKNIKINDNYSLVIFGQFAVNPAKEDAFLVFGIRF